MSLPYFPMFPTDFEAKTSHLTLEEDGAYNRLLRLMWMTPGCSLPDDDAWIMRRMRCDAETYERVVRPVIEEFCTRSKGRVSNAKLTRIFDESSAKHERRVSAGSSGGKAKARKTNKTASSNARAMPKQPEPEPELDITPLPPKGENERSLFEADQEPKREPDRFEEFWSAYPHRNGAKRGKAEARKRWDAARRRGVSQQTMIDGASDARRDPNVVRGYARDPTTWLNQCGWEDEIPKNPVQTIQQRPQSARDGRVAALLGDRRQA